MTTSIPTAWPALKRTYTVATVLIGAIAMAACGIVVAVLGGDGQAIVAASSALALGIVISLAPVFVGAKPDSFGMAVLAASGARMLIVFGIVLIASIALDLPRKPIGLGAAAGLLLTLIAETMLAMAILSRVNRKTELA